MDQEVQAEATLGEDIAAAFEQHTEPTETAEQAAERARDEKGRFAKSEASSAEALDSKASVVADAAKQPSQGTDAVAQQRPQRPSSWKKDYWEHWDKLDPALANYLHQREQEYAKGVSTYKTEWENAKPLIEAMAPFQPLLQQHNIQPQQWITNLGNAHRQLALGTPQEKLQMFQRLAQDYGVPLQSLFVQPGQPDPLQYVNPLYRQIQQLQGDLNTFKTQREQEQQQAIQSEIQKFAATHPHYESVRETMAGLLQSNVAPDLDSAYEKAIRLHDDIWSQVQADKAKADAQEKLKQTQATTQRAKANAVSPRSATTGTPGQAKADKSLRGDLEDAFEELGASRV